MAAERLRSQFHAHQRAYDIREVWADSIVQIIAVVSGVIGGAILIAHAPEKPVLIYVASLISMLGFSATYNIWPVSEVKWFLRRFDHAAIYFLIAGTYTALLPFLQNKAEAITLGVVIWFGAVIGMALKFFVPGKFDRVAIAIYLGLGWAGILSIRSFMAVLPNPVQILIAAGGIIYSLGVVFHMWDSLKYQNAIWHVFVAVAAGCHFAAIALLYR